MLAQNLKIYKKERIKKRNDISSLFENDVEFYSGVYFYIRLKRNDFNFSRFFVGVKKGNYTAVERNKLKRIVRELYRHNKSIIPSCYDYFILIKGFTNTANYQRDFINLFQRVEK